MGGLSPKAGQRVVRIKINDGGPAITLSRPDTGIYSNQLRILTNRAEEKAQKFTYNGGNLPRIADRLKMQNWNSS